MKIVSVAGTKKTGKTTLVTRLVGELVKRGFKVGTIKNTHGNLDIEGKDTWKHREAGAQLVVGVGEEIVFIVDEPLELDDIIRKIECLEELDFLVIEGFKKSPYTKIATSDLPGPLVLARVDVEKVDEDDLKALVDQVETRTFGLLANMDCQECGFDSCQKMSEAVVKGTASEDICVMKKMENVVLSIEGVKVPLNPFVQKFVKNTFLGMISSMKIEADEIQDKKIELLIQNEGN
ncbi:MAG: molybdopterin-guanine dinucleotide biosynthesis protein B [Methanobacteriaceae archaeon]|nr:molybdopterin-guanine dinucleotide biosynthesis protein B [Methanobacteriaceae archaeon]